MKEITPKKSLGQYWLNDPDAIKAICKAGQVDTKDTVLEIGPGTGTLTRQLVKLAGQVIAVEFDENLAGKLSEQGFPSNLQIIKSDILKFNLTSLPAGYKIVANIPYYLTSKLLRVLSETSNQPSKVVLLVQKEVAERVAAKPGDMSLLSVSAQFYWKISLGQVVPACLFTPPPKVDSQILIMDQREGPLFSGVDTKLLFRVVKAGFSARRKTLLNSLSDGLKLDKDRTNHILSKSHISATARAQTLNLEDWHRLSQAYQTVL